MIINYCRIKISREYWGRFPGKPLVIIARGIIDINDCIVATCEDYETYDYIDSCLVDLPLKKIVDIYSGFERERNRDGFELRWKYEKTQLQPK